MFKREQFKVSFSVARVNYLTAALLLSTCFTNTSKADSVTFHIKNDSAYRVQVEFYSQRLNRAWPGGGEAWVQYDGVTHEYNLSCIPGETICYGAWTMPNHTSFWGGWRRWQEGLF